MSIRPPSDIVLDVAMAADPTARALAARRLDAAAGSGADFARVAASASGPSPDATLAALAGSRPGRAAAPSSMAKAQRDLETFFMRTAIETMLPDTSKGAFGLGAAGGVWRGMLAEKLADQIGAAGGLGLMKGGKA